MVQIQSAYELTAESNLPSSNFLLQKLIVKHSGTPFYELSKGKKIDKLRDFAEYNEGLLSFESPIELTGEHFQSVAPTTMMEWLIILSVVLVILGFPVILYILSEILTTLFYKWLLIATVITVPVLYFFF